MLTVAQRWAIAPTAIMVRYNLEDCGVLGGMVPSDAARAEAIDNLEGWDVDDRASAREQIQELLADDRAPTKAQAHFIKQHADVLGARGLRGYQLASVSYVAGQAYLAGYLDEAAAWRACFAAARRIQRTFTSWEQLGRDYLLGDELDNGEPDAGCYHVYRALVLEHDGPWSLPWRTPLGASE